jgi:hypothetical protein
LDITATDQIRPIATTTAIPTIPARICFPLHRVELLAPPHAQILPVGGA